MKYKHIKSKKTKSFSLIVVPHSKKTKQFKMATWIPKFMITIILISISYFSYYTWDLYNSNEAIKKDYQTKVKRLSLLETVSTNQRNEIENLKQKTSDFQTRLDSLSVLEKTVKNMVGLKDTSKDTNENNSNSSRSGSLLLRNTPQIDSATDAFEAQMNELTLLLNQSQSHLNKLITDVEKRLDYLEAKPNLMPTTGTITSGFGYRRNPFGRGREFHYGLDIANRSRTEIKAAGSGIVTFAGYKSGYGYVIILSHGYGYQSIYGHNRKLLVKVGESVEKGQLISEMGSSGRSTGTHLHFEVRYYGKPINPTKVINNED